MDREASLLRCSKLSCYAEFNRMVQAIARNGREITAIPTARSMHGTSAEYYFYTTLVMMLKQIISNPDPAAQQRELQSVYQWFSVNKPLMTTKTKPGHRKPTLSLTSSSRLTAPCQTSRLMSIVDCERPQTAPASLYKLHPPSHHHHPHTPPTQPPQHSFTSTFMTRSLSREMEKVGRRDGRVGVPFEGLQLGMETQVDGIVETPSLNSRATRSSNSRVKRKEARVLARDGGRGRGDVRGSPVSIVSIPTPDSLSGQVSSPALSFGIVFAKVPNIAAKMELNREMREVHKTTLKQSALSSANHGGPTFQQQSALSSANHGGPTFQQQSALSSANHGGPTFQQQSALSSANHGGPTFQQLTNKQKTKTRTGLVATEVSTPPRNKAPQSPDSNNHCDESTNKVECNHCDESTNKVECNHCDESTNKVECTSLTVDEESGLELKPDGMGVGHISVSVSHHDSSDARGDTLQHGRAADGGDRSTHKTARKYQNMTVVNTEQAKQTSCGHVFLTTTVDSASPKDAEPKATLDSASPKDAEPKATEHAAQQTNIRSEDTKLEREPHTNNQEATVTQSSVQASREGESISQEADIEAIGCSRAEQTVESSMFGVTGVSVQNTRSSPSANTSGQKETPRTHKKVSTPMNIITITFPSTLEHTNRPQTSFGERRRSKTSAFVSASGFNKTRYRPRTMAASNTC